MAINSRRQVARPIATFDLRVRVVATKVRHRPNRTGSKVVVMGRGPEDLPLLTKALGAILLSLAMEVVTGDLLLLSKATADRNKVMAVLRKAMAVLHKATVAPLLRAMVVLRKATAALNKVTVDLHKATEVPSQATEVLSRAMVDHNRATEGLLNNRAMADLQKATASDCHLASQAAREDHLSDVMIIRDRVNGVVAVVGTTGTRLRGTKGDESGGNDDCVVCSRDEAVSVLGRSFTGWVHK